MPPTKNCENGIQFQSLLFEARHLEYPEERSSDCVFVAKTSTNDKSYRPSVNASVALNPVAKRREFVLPKDREIGPRHHLSNLLQPAAAPIS
ncbi:abc transporter [Moniliophthora roreri]|uniref:Uncharacterized protein n=1 Tax=Moniliophthora roreri TaxID=221103 RepID=A0A0W0G7N5_MONRR|nr:abc transporter [Moniliophthora roreri]